MGLIMLDRSSIMASMNLLSNQDRARVVSSLVERLLDPGDRQTDHRWLDHCK